MSNEVNDNAAACEQIDRDQRTLVLPVYVHCWMNHEDKMQYALFSNDMTPYSAMYTLMGKTELVYLTPEDFDLRARQVAALEREKTQITLEFNTRLKEIEEKISRLTAIEYTPTEF
jgi:hypothetical protein